MKTLVAFVALALTACAEAPDETVSTSTDGPSTYAPQRVPGGVAITEVGGLIGQYRVAGIDEAQVPGDEGIALSIDGALMSFEPVCAGFVWRIEFAGETLSTIREPDLAERLPGELEPVECSSGVTPARWWLAEALDAATYAQRTPANGIRLSGGGHAVLLFSQ